MTLDHGTFTLPDNILNDRRYSTLVKILWLAHRDPMNPKAGGAERTIYEVCTRLTQKGHSITIIAASWSNSPSHSELEGVEIIRPGGNVYLHLFIPIFLLSNKFDIVVNDLGHAIPWPSASLFCKNNIVFFRHLHARSLPGQVSSILATLITVVEKCYFLIYRRIPFVTESTTSRKDLLDLGIKNEEIFMNPPGVDKHLFCPTKKTENPSIVYFGGMRKYKRPDESIYLLWSLSQKIQGIKLVIIGEGLEKINLERLSIKLNLRDSIIFTGRISDEELSRTVSSSWLNVHSSVTEGWGLSILEASSAGTPTVAYEVPGVVDVIENGINGMKVKDGDRKALYRAALEILSDPERWWSSAIEVAKKYSWDQTAEMWNDLIHEVANQ